MMVVFSEPGGQDFDTINEKGVARGRKGMPASMFVPNPWLELQYVLSPKQIAILSNFLKFSIFNLFIMKMFGF
jgi:hypothetical protein